MKTTKEIADIIGVSKMTVYRYIKKNKIVGTQQSNRTMLYDDTVVKTIIKAFTSEYSETSVTSSDTAEIDFNSLIINYQEQIKAKDKQLESMQKLLDQQQQLSLQDKNQLIEIKERTKELENLLEIKKDTDTNKKTPKKKWYKFWL